MDQIGSRDLCSICFPRWPKPKVLHRTCELCKPGQSKPYPCCHNGGVEVLAPAGEVERRIYVWPEHAYRYRLAPPAIRV